MVFKDWLQALGKLDYVRGKSRPNIDCILCGVRDDDERVVSLKIYHDDLLFISLNLYPYNPGHLMVVPNRHLVNFNDLSKEEIIHISRTIQGIQLLLDYLYHPLGYNIGMNQGKIAGASIDHLHFHIVPRYGAELGYIDIVGKTRVVLEGLESVKQKLKANINKFLTKSFFENF
ncbi:MAG: HIT family protein [Promethearchaeota archaeon]